MTSISKIEMAATEASTTSKYIALPMVEITFTFVTHDLSQCQSEPHNHGVNASISASSGSTLKRGPALISSR